MGLFWFCLVLWVLSGFWFVILFEFVFGVVGIVFCGCCWVVLLFVFWGGGVVMVLFRVFVMCLCLGFGV